MMTRLGVGLVAAGDSVCAATARPGSVDDPEVAKDLNLNDAQNNQMDQVYQEDRPRMFDVRGEVNKAEAAVEAAFNEDPVDQAKANDAINRLAAARSELTKAVSQMDLKLRTILTAQQWQELKQNAARAVARPRRPPARPTSKCHRTC